MKKIAFLSSFILKIIALLTMTFDHVGLLLETMHPFDSNILLVAGVFRGIGRIALPLFVFMIVEGVIHTKNFKKYILRLGIMAAIISLVFIIMEYTELKHSAHGLLRAGNIFLDLSLVATSIYCLRHEKIWMKFLTLLPVAFSILSFVVKGVEFSSGIDIHWFPSFITMQYDIFAIALGLTFYASYKLADLYIKSMESTTGMDKSIWEANGNYRVVVNLLSAFMLALVSFLYYCVKFVWPSGVFWNANIELFAIISGAFILMYNGKRGYNSKWFQYGSYLYYPLHLVVIIVIFIIVNGGL